ncbi:hypothetical protein BN946_scf184693.g9 [Trametes cinnabarina]|uniref:CoA carboxyltransferase C-terminal domain-containing protein n=1 Tax=Pycnoporus cinnabarinus TaxID=5643 RepID=A0A060SM22_PYCCI|nr:hypothetical protein BN946_scf184693.g9 [Trametes cinnabarina]
MRKKDEDENAHHSGSEEDRKTKATRLSAGSDDGVTWKVLILPQLECVKQSITFDLTFQPWQHAVDKIRRIQHLNTTPNLQNPGYVRQKQNSKLWVRERLGALLDCDSFIEVGSLTGKPVLDKSTGELKDFTPAYVLMFTLSCQALATQHKVPIIRLLDGSSGGGSVATYLTVGATYIPPLAGLGQSMTAMTTVPVVSALLGPVVGLGSAKAVTSHFSVMVKGLSQLFAAGPPVVKQATYEDLSKEALGGWEIHGRNGTIDNVAMSELDAFQQIKTFLSFLPSSIYAMPPVLSSSDPADRREEELVSIIPRRRTRTYDIRRLIHLVVDINRQAEREDSFFEIGSTWGRSVVTGLARLCGMPVGVLSSDCTVGGGVLDALASQKAARFVNLCDQFGSVPSHVILDFDY